MAASRRHDGRGASGLGRCTTPFSPSSQATILIVQYTSSSYGTLNGALFIGHLAYIAPSRPSNKLYCLHRAGLLFGGSLYQALRKVLFQLSGPGIHGKVHIACVTV